MSAEREKAGHARWTICALLFAATTINYLDRNILGILAPTLKARIGWTEVQYGYITTLFQAAYALGLGFFGWFIDRVGTKIGYAASVIGWSLAAMAHALASTVAGFGAARFFLGLSESGNFPSAVKTTAEWFPKKERALATGIFNSGSNVGAIVAPALVPWLTLTFGWQAAFVATGAIGFLWVVLWLRLYEKPERKKGVRPRELAHILSDPPDPPGEKARWLELLRYRQTWALIVARFLTDPIWWFYLYWLGLYLNKNFGLSLGRLGPPLVVIYMMTCLGSIGGGWMSSAMIGRGAAPNAGRKRAMLLCAVLVVPIVVAARLTDLWPAVLLIGLAAAAHQGWSANVFTAVSDMFPKRAVGSVTGLAGLAGSIGGMILMSSAGHIVQKTGSYNVLFIICGSAYLVALAIFQVLAPRMEPVRLG